MLKGDTNETIVRCMACCERFPIGAHPTRKDRNVAKKTYRIAIESDVHFGVFLAELKNWQITPALYKVDGNSIITSNNNVIDVATETFINNRSVLNIQAVK